MIYFFRHCWVNGSHSPTFTFSKAVNREELIDLCRTWQPERIQRLR